MTKGIKDIYCTHIRKKTYISVDTKIVSKQHVFIEGSVQCRFNVFYGCDKAKDCPQVSLAYKQWVDSGSYL
jgi:hypothetical protein